MSIKGILDNKILNLSFALLFALAVVFSFGVFAYADNDESVTDLDINSNSVTDDVIYDYLSFVDNKGNVVTKEIASVNATSSVYSIDDVYRILNSWNWPSGSSQAYVRDDRLYNEVGLVRNDLSTTNTRLLSIQNSLANQDFSQLHTDLTTINSSITSGNSTNHTDFANTYTLINNFKSANHTDLNTINTSISNLSNDINNISWQVSNGSVILRDKNYNTITTTGSYYPMYFTFTGLEQGTCLYRFHIYYTENYGNTNLNLQLGTFANGKFNPMIDDNIFYTYTGSNQGYDIYVYSPSFAYTNYSVQALTIKVDNGYLYRTNVLSYYLPIGSKDFNDSLNAITSLATSKNTNHIDYDLHKFVDIYASDDLIAAKQEQQAVEDSAISDFSGNGSAAMKGSDVTSAKNISNQVSTGLNAGGSVSNGLDVFSSNNAFWGWFSQDCASYFDVDVPADSTPQPVLRSNRSQWTDDVPDVLSSIDREYYESLGD